MDIEKTEKNRREIANEILNAEFIPEDGAWTPEAKTTTKITDRLNERGVEAWERLVKRTIQLLAGTDKLTGGQDGFTAEDTRWRPEDGKITTALLEAFTQKLIPPSPAAGLFLRAGLNPKWGIRLARTWQRGEISMLEDEQAKRLESIEKAVGSFMLSVEAQVAGGGSLGYREAGEWMDELLSELNGRLPEAVKISDKTGSGGELFWEDLHKKVLQPAGVVEVVNFNDSVKFAGDFDPNEGESPFTSA